MCYIIANIRIPEDVSPENMPQFRYLSDVPFPSLEAAVSALHAIWREELALNYAPENTEDPTPFSHCPIVLWNIHDDTDSYVITNHPGPQPYTTRALDGTRHDNPFVIAEAAHSVAETERIVLDRGPHGLSALVGDIPNQWFGSHVMDDDGNPTDELEPETVRIHFKPLEMPDPYSDLPEGHEGLRMAHRAAEAYRSLTDTPQVAAPGTIGAILEQMAKSFGLDPSSVSVLDLTGAPTGPDKSTPNTPVKRDAPGLTERG